MMTMDSIVEHFGTRSKLARALGVTPVSITQWCGWGYFPAGRAIQLERITKGHFKAINIPTLSAETLHDAKERKQAV